MNTGKAISQDATRPSKRVGILLVVLGICFTLGGASFLYFATVRPLLRISAARSWTPVVCTIVAAEVKQHDDGDGGSTYSIEMAYSYKFNGRDCVGHRYNFVEGSSSSSGWRYAVVRAHPPGRRTTCYVNPNDPTDAVIERGPHRELFWVGLLSLLFVLIGVGLLGGVVLHRRRAAEPFGPRAALSSNSRKPSGVIPIDSDADDGPIRLKPKMTPLKTLFAALFAALFWNGIVSIFVWQLFSKWQQGAFDVFLCVFLTPFVLIGIGLIAFVGVSALGLFNPVPVLTLSHGSIPLGGSGRLSWTFAGNTNAVRTLKISLKGVERATCGQGDSNKTETSVFYDRVLVDSTEIDPFTEGEVDFEIPTDLMHSFVARNNSVAWSIDVIADIPIWPDVKVQFPLTVVPHERSFA